MNEKFDDIIINDEEAIKLMMQVADLVEEVTNNNKKIEVILEKLRRLSKEKLVSF